MQNRLKELMKEKGISREALAEAIDAHPVTVSKLASGKMRLTDVWVEKLATALAVAPGELFSALGPRLVTVKGHVQAGHWAESNEWPPDDWYNVPIPDDEEWRGERLYAAEARGPSMDLVFPEGTVIVFTAWVQSEQDILPGKRYIVEVERTDGLREATVKTLWQDENGKFWLLPESTDPRFKEAIALDGNEGDTIMLKGRVVYSVRRE